MEMAWTFSKVFMNKLFQSPLKGRPQQEGGCRPEEQHHKGEKTEKIPVRVRGSFLRKVETNEVSFEGVLSVYPLFFNKVCGFCVGLWQIF